MLELNGFPKHTWIAYLEQDRPDLAFSSNRLKREYLVSLLREIQSLIQDGKIGNAIDRIVLGFYIDKDYFLLNIKKAAVLRHSSYLRRKNPVTGIAMHLLQHQAFLGFTKEETDYFESLINFEEFHKELVKANRYIDAELAKFRCPTVLASNGNLPASRVKALLAKNDYYFLTFRRPNEVRLDLTQYDFYSKEEISEAISMLVSRYAETYGFKDTDLGLVDGDYAAGSNIEQLLLNACRYRAIVELEMEIEVYGFICTKENGTLVIDHPDRDFIRSVELANIQYRLQTITNVIYNHVGNTGAALLTDLSKQYHQAFPDFFVRKTDPFERYTLAILPHVFSSLIGGKSAGYFREEFMILQEISKNLLIRPEKLVDYELRPGFSFADFQKLSRFFFILYHIVAPKMEGLIGTVPDKIVYRSLIWSVKKEQLIEYLTMLMLKEKVMVFLDMITWKSSDIKKYLDLQYRPIIEHGPNFLVPSCVMGLSNLPRSVFLSESKLGHNIKGDQIHHHTTIAEILGASFKLHGFQTYSELPVTFRGKGQSEGDIDFMAFKDGTLFIAECKDTVHPTDLFEMRTTYSYIKKAASQLDFLIEALADSSFAERFLKDQGISLMDVKKIETAIVLSNNKFWGYRIGGHPIRNVKELDAYVSTGTWSISHGEGIAKFKLWKGKDFQAQDLSNFLSVHSPHTSFHNSCNEVMIKFGSKLYKRSYTLLPEKIGAYLAASYPFDLVDIPDINGEGNEESDSV